MSLVWPMLSIRSWNTRENSFPPFEKVSFILLCKKMNTEKRRDCVPVYEAECNEKVRFTKKHRQREEITMEKMENVYIMDHPLIKHKISMLRDKSTGTNEFRKLVEEIGILMGYEALRDLPTEEVEIETPIETCKTPMISGKKLAVIPVLRAGLGMVNSILTLVPSAKVGHVGLYRDPVTHEPHEYYCKLPESIDERISVIVDPMLATGGSAEAAIDFVKKQGGKNIKFMCIIAAPEGLKRLHEAHPDVQIYCGSLDRELNENAYICPGLGDAGDRIFGTK